jgi:hypothetical protein
MIVLNEQHLRRACATTSATTAPRARTSLSTKTRPRHAPSSHHVQAGSSLCHSSAASTTVTSTAPSSRTGSQPSPGTAGEDPCSPGVRQEQILIPNPLPGRCNPSYPFCLSNSQSDWDEIDTVVDYLRELRGVDKVSLAGWSRGGRRVGCSSMSPARHTSSFGRTST